MHASGGSGRLCARLSHWVIGLLAAVAALAVSAAGAEPRPDLLARQAVVLNGDLVGSAFALSEGLAVTNRHVLRGLRAGDDVDLLAGGFRISAHLVAASARMDLALLAIPPGALVPAADATAEPAPGTAVVAAGIEAASGERRTEAGRLVLPRLDLPAFGPGLVARIPGARPGFSGGPLFDGAGRLLGMLTALRPSPGSPAAASAGPATDRPGPGVEAFALRIAAVRAEAARLLAGGS